MRTGREDRRVGGDQDVPRGEDAVVAGRRPGSTRASRPQVGAPEVAHDLGLGAGDFGQGVAGEHQVGLREAAGREVAARDLADSDPAARRPASARNGGLASSQVISRAGAMPHAPPSSRRPARCPRRAGARAQNRRPRRPRRTRRQSPRRWRAGGRAHTPARRRAADGGGRGPARAIRGRGRGRPLGEVAAWPALELAIDGGPERPRERRRQVSPSGQGVGPSLARSRRHGRVGQARGVRRPRRCGRCGPAPGAPLRRPASGQRPKITASGTACSPTSRRRNPSGRRPGRRRP